MNSKADLSVVVENETGSGGPEAQYFARLSRGEFAVQACQACEARIFYPRTVCPHCGGTRLTWVSASGRGTVYASTRLKDKAGQPYNVCLVDLEEGPRLMSRVEGFPDAAAPIGLAVKARLSLEGHTPVLGVDPVERVHG